MTQENEIHILEAELSNTEPEPTGKEWAVTIIGPRKNDPSSLVVIAGKEYIRSKNGRLYAVDGLRESVSMWEGVKVYDDHQTDEEMQARGGMRSPHREWLGTLVSPVWDAAERKLKAVFKVVENSLSEKLLNAYRQKVLDSVGLSLDAFPIMDKPIVYEGQSYPVAKGFKKIRSLDFVGDPAAGGGFDRVIAAHINKQENIDMAEDYVTKVDFDEFKSDLQATVKGTLSEALAAQAPEPVQEAEQTGADDGGEEVAAALQEAKILKSEVAVERKVNEAKLSPEFAKLVNDNFSGRVVEAAEVDGFIKTIKEAQAKQDTSGRPNGITGERVEVSFDEQDKFALGVQRAIMGERAFRALEGDNDDRVDERIQENTHYQDWVKKGKPNLGRPESLSRVLYGYLGGDPLFDSRLLEAATTSTLSTITKNTVNIMTAANYTKRERWYEPLVTVEEVDTIDQSTLARMFGADTLSVVEEGGAYTELALADEEETADFVKRGNYIGITLETMMKDKLNYIRSIPQLLADSWYNTLSDSVANVFTVNSNVGPVLSDTGALFNATAVGTGGGHANLLTTALSHTAWGAARTAMRKQTNRPLGAGRKLLIEPRYLLVPEDLETTGLIIQESELVPEADGAGTSGNQTRNVYQGKFQTVVVPSWTDANDWAAVADPNMFPAIYHIFPRGSRTPQLFSAGDENAGSMFTNDELRFKVRLAHYRFSSAYDCAPVADWRPLHKSNVA